MSKSTSDLCLIMKSGGCVSISSQKSTSDLCSIARAGLETQATLTIREADKKSTSDLCQIAKENPGHVIFEFE